MLAWQASLAPSNRQPRDAMKTVPGTSTGSKIKPETLLIRREVHYELPELPNQTL